MALLSHRINYDRRRLLTALLLSPLCFSAWAKTETPPDLRRIVALEWLPAELLLALGVTPLGVAEIPNYLLWVAEPQLPESVIDVGFRTEPNMELLTQLGPSLMVYSAGYGPSVEKMSRIAPSMGFTFNNEAVRPLTMFGVAIFLSAQLVNVAGIIGFVGLFAPLLARMLRARPLVATALAGPITGGAAAVIDRSNRAVADPRLA